MNSFRYSENYGSGSGLIGFDELLLGRRDEPTRILVILNRWHELNRPNGNTHVTMIVGGFSEAFYAADNGYGELISLDPRRDFHYTSPQDD